MLSPTNKGSYSRADLDAFRDRRRQFLATSAAYVEIDALPEGQRWLPQCLRELDGYAGVVWTSVPANAARQFEGWAWRVGDRLPTVPWDLGEFGELRLDLESTLVEALTAAGL